jgi:hypothetical protein
MLTFEKERHLDETKFWDFVGPMGDTLVDKLATCDTATAAAVDVENQPKQAKKVEKTNEETREEEM